MSGNAYSQQYPNDGLSGDVWHKGEWVVWVILLYGITCMVESTPGIRLHRKLWQWLSEPRSTDSGLGYSTKTSCVDVWAQTGAQDLKPREWWVLQSPSSSLNVHAASFSVIGWALQAWFCSLGLCCGSCLLCRCTLRGHTSPPIQWRQASRDGDWAKHRLSSQSIPASTSKLSWKKN